MVAPEGNNLTYPKVDEHVAVTSDFKRRAEKKVKKHQPIRQLSKKVFEKVLRDIKLQDQKLTVITRHIATNLKAIALSTKPRTQSLESTLSMPATLTLTQQHSTNLWTKLDICTIT
jgi:hypothetical protein